MEPLAARYFDGRSARPQPARLWLHDGLLRIETADGTHEHPAAAASALPGRTFRQ